MTELRFWVERVYLRSGGGWEPPMDILEDNEAYHIIMDIAGVSERDIEVWYHPNGHLIVRGERHPPVQKCVQCLLLEIPYGTFERRIPLPKGVNSDAIEVTYRSGLLHIRVPKREEKPSEGHRLTIR